MIKVGQVVKLKNPKKREAKRRWRVIKFDIPTTVTPITVPPLYEGSPAGTASSPMMFVTTAGKEAIVRRVDTATHRLERADENILAPISFWERLTKRY